MVALDDADTEKSKMKKIEFNMRQLRIEENFFNINVYAN